MGHIGLTPQSIHALGGFKVQGKELDAAQALTDDAIALAEAGCFAIVLECVPDAVARMITESVADPDDRHRRGPALRRSGARVARHPRLRGRGSPAPEVRARVRGVRARRVDRDRAVLHRRARGHVPVERRDVPHDRSHDRGARPLRRDRARSSPSSRSSASVSTRARRRRSRPSIAVVVGDRHRGARGAVGVSAATARAARAVAASRATPAVAPFAGYREVRVAVDGRCVRVVVADTDGAARTRAARHVATSARTRACCSCSRGDSRRRVHDGGRDAIRSRSRGTRPTARASTARTWRRARPATPSDCPVYRSAAPYRYRARNCRAAAQPRRISSPCWMRLVQPVQVSHPVCRVAPDRTFEVI